MGCQRNGFQRRSATKAGRAVALPDAAHGRRLWRWQQVLASASRAKFEGSIRPAQSGRTNGRTAHLAAFLRVEQHHGFVGLGIDELPLACADKDELASNRN